MRVCVLESGGFGLDDDTQSLSTGEIVGLPYCPLDENRQRQFGGTTGLWAGWCRPFDELDFEERTWVPHSGWPIARSELLPYYARAHEVCQLGQFEYATGFWERELNAKRAQLSQRLVTRMYRMSPPTRFGQVYREKLSKASNVRIYLFANVLNIEANDTASAITHLAVGCLNGNRFKVNAKRYVIASGGIENARLLLNSNNVKREGLGNDHDLVGRFFMDHIHFPSGVILLSKHNFPASLYIKHRNSAVARLFLSRVVQRSEGMLNYNAMLQPTYPWFQKSDLTKVKSILSLARRATRLPKDLANLLGALRVHHTLEPSPNPKSRITLGPDLDPLGLKRVRLDWQTTTLEQHTVQRAREIVGEEFERAGLGVLMNDSEHGTENWPPLPLQGRLGHHMGTTRMNMNPEQGVVDKNCRVHDIANLFIAGSSVFPTGGAGTPTLTIVALALRLADYITSGAKG